MVILENQKKLNLRSGEIIVFVMILMEAITNVKSEDTPIV